MFATLPRQVGSHLAALRIVGVVEGDVAGAEAYARRHLGPPGHHHLLDMLLRPGPGRPPMLLQACHLMHAAGGHADRRPRLGGTHLSAASSRPRLVTIWQPFLGPCARPGGLIPYFPRLTAVTTLEMGRAARHGATAARSL